MEGNTTRRSYKKAIVILLALLLLSGTALGARLFYLKNVADKGNPVIVPDNTITEESATPTQSPADIGEGASSAGPAIEESTSGNTQPTTPDAAGPSSSQSSASRPSRKKATIALYQGQASDNARFDVANMLPGDAVTQNFAVKVSHKRSTTVYFRAQVTAQTKSLADILHIKVTHLETGNVLYDGPFAAMDDDGHPETFTYTGDRETVGNYRIDVSLPTSAGNEYQGATLEADFDWFILRDTDSGAGGSGSGTSTLVPPKTGDAFSLTLYAAVALSAAALLVLLFRRRKEAAHE